MKQNEKLFFTNLLQENGYRVTLGRITLLVFLKNSKKPLSVEEIHKGMPQKLDKVTLYRALEDFSVSKIVGKIHLQNSATYYELLHKDHHHHHIICEGCGKIEDIEHCEQTNLQKKILQTSKSFFTISSHSLEFFGLCKKCAQ